MYPDIGTISGIGSSGIMNTQGVSSINNNSPDTSFAINSKIMIVAVAVLFSVVFFIIGLHVYAKWFWRSGGRGVSGRGWRRRRRLEFAPDWPGHSTTDTQTGLDKAVVDSLPTFTYSEEKSAAAKEVMECAVCLEEFAEGERGRLLPKCAHSFHIDCIDMWFHTHSTCPLCRCSVAPDEADQVAAGILAQQREGESASSSADVVLNIIEGSGDNNTSYERHRQAGAAAAAAVTTASVDLRTSYGGSHERSTEEDTSPGSEPEAGPESQLSRPPTPRRSVLESPSSRRLVPESPSSRRSVQESPSFGRKPTSVAPKPSSVEPKPVGIPPNVLFFGNGTQMGVTQAAPVPREENSGRRSGVQPLNRLRIEIPRGQQGQDYNGSVGSDDPHRSSVDAQQPKSPIGRLVTSSFRRLLSIGRSTNSAVIDGVCIDECENGRDRDFGLGPVTQPLQPSQDREEGQFLQANRDQSQIVQPSCEQGQISIANRHIPPANRDVFRPGCDPSKFLQTGVMLTTG